MRAALEPRLLILCPLTKEWSFLVSTFDASLHVERLHDLKIKTAYIPHWHALVVLRMERERRNRRRGRSQAFACPGTNRSSPLSSSDRQAAARRRRAWFSADVTGG